MLRRAKRRFGISAPRLSVRAHIPWYLRWSMVLPFVVGALALMWFAYDSGLEFAGFHRGETQQELTDLREQVVKLTAENTLLNGQVAKYEREIQIEQSSGKENAAQLKSLNDEVAKLQEDLAFFQSSTVSSGKSGDLTVHRLRLERDSIPGEYQIRMLVVHSGPRAKEFVGGYQLVATVVKNGQKSTQLFPHETTGNAQFQLKFKYYQRVEQSIKIAPDAQLESVQLRLFEQGVREPKIRQNVSIS